MRVVRTRGARRLSRVPSPIVHGRIDVEQPSERAQRVGTESDDHDCRSLLQRRPQVARRALLDRPPEDAVALPRKLAWIWATRPLPVPDQQKVVQRDDRRDQREHGDEERVGVSP